MLIWLANLLSIATPQTRMFRTRRFAYSVAGVDVPSGVRLSGGARIHYANVGIGTGTWVGYGSQLISTRSAAIQIGTNCDLGPEVMLVVGSHELGAPRRRAARGLSSPIDIGEGTWLGARSTILGGARIGAGSVVAAGALVLPGDYPANSLLAGVPARVVKELPAGDGD